MRLEAELGFVYDQAGPIGEIVGAPWARTMTARFHGRAAHSGIAPEEGRSAIAAAARAVADLRLGRVDEETTANVGLISGGSARNIIPEWCTLEAEARSHDIVKLADFVQEMLEAFALARVPRRRHGRDGGERGVPRLLLQSRQPDVELAATALERRGYESRPR